MFIHLHFDEYFAFDALDPRRFRFKNQLYSMDATVIDLCLSEFPWAEFRHRKVKWTPAIRQNQVELKLVTCCCSCS